MAEQFQKLGEGSSLGAYLEAASGGKSLMKSEIGTFLNVNCGKKLIYKSHSETREKAFIEHVPLLKVSNMEIHRGWKTNTRIKTRRKV